MLNILITVFLKSLLPLFLYCCYYYFVHSRFKLVRNRDPNFEQRWMHLGKLSVQAEFNWDDEIEPEPISKNAVDTR